MCGLEDDVNFYEDDEENNDWRLDYYDEDYEYDYANYYDKNYVYDLDSPINEDDLPY